MSASNACMLATSPCLLPPPKKTHVNLSLREKDQKSYFKVESFSKLNICDLSLFIFYVYWHHINIYLYILPFSVHHAWYQFSFKLITKQQMQKVGISAKVTKKSIVCYVSRFDFASPSNSELSNFQIANHWDFLIFKRWIGYLFGL